MKPSETPEKIFSPLLIDRKPCAAANITGLPAAPGVCGTVRFYTTPLGVIVTAEIGGLPPKTPTESYRVCFRDRKPPASLPCAPDGRGGILTHLFSVEDVLGRYIGVYRNDDGEPLASGEVRQAAY